MNSFKDFVVDQLRDVSCLKCRSMFGGYGLYSGDTFFAIVYDEALYLKTSKDSLDDFVKAGMSPFQPVKKQELKSFYEVPPDILEDRDALSEWADRAITQAVLGNGTKRARRR